MKACKTIHNKTIKSISMTLTPNIKSKSKAWKRILAYKIYIPYLKSKGN